MSRAGSPGSPESKPKSLGVMPEPKDRILPSSDDAVSLMRSRPSPMLNIYVSLPAPPISVSLPFPPWIVSFPGPVSTVSLPPSALITSLPAPAVITSSPSVIAGPKKLARLTTPVCKSKRLDDGIPFTPVKSKFVNRIASPPDPIAIVRFRVVPSSVNVRSFRVMPSPNWILLPAPVMAMSQSYQSHLQG